MSNYFCEWSDIFDERSRRNLEAGFVITGAMSAVAGCWLYLVLLLTDLRSDRSYRNLAFFIFISFVRRAVSIFNHFPLQHFSESDDYEKSISCDFFGFVETFFAVYEYECLTHVCIERYVVAKYIINGWPIQKNHYTLFQGLCLFFSALYAFPPLFGLGRFGPDFSCQSCVLDMVLPESWDRYVILTIFLLRSVKSTGFIVTMLVWACNLEARYEDSPELLRQKRFTESVVTMTGVNIICWTPIAMIRGCVLLYQVLASDDLVRPSATLIKLAVWLQWAAPAFTTAAMFLTDSRIRSKMIGGQKKLDKNELSKKE